MSEWVERARLKLARNGVGAEVADSVLAEVEQHCADSGENAQEAFGTPAEFARSVAAERVPIEDRAARDRMGFTAQQRRRGLIASFGVQLLLVGALVWAKVGASVPLTLAGVVGTALSVAACVGAVYAAFELRPAGRPRSVGKAFVFVAAGVVLGGMSFGWLPKTRLFTMPVLVIPALGVVLLAWAVWRKPKPVTAEAPAGTEEWLSRLGGLLEGRHDVPRARAGELVEEARQHLVAGGLSPEDEFGPAEHYAAELAAHEPARLPWWRRDRVHNVALAAFFLAYLLPGVVGGVSTWALVVAGGMVLVAGALVLFARVRS
ncbi:hypothetical protein [Allokutzneria albata]|uniref:Uncharacterized protein n=1 Tax=Allokutzneria albata TaxID=211114 RepID=A0A1G9RNW8_ALLAB|nr:hypothetical protein [Allokutzneria albata]SDM24988.1 hypothetical protein SAMN04489726_0586 [Allokutzneria albata]